VLDVKRHYVSNISSMIIIQKYVNFGREFRINIKINKNLNVILQFLLNGNNIRMVIYRRKCGVKYAYKVNGSETYLKFVKIG